MSKLATSLVKACYFRKSIIRVSPQSEKVRVLTHAPDEAHLNPRQRQTDAGHRIADEPNWQMSMSLLSVLMGKLILFNCGQVL